jgi:hypothetical protein
MTKYVLLCQLGVLLLAIAAYAETEVSPTVRAAYLKQDYSAVLADCNWLEWEPDGQHKWDAKAVTTDSPSEQEQRMLSSWQFSDGAEFNVPHQLFNVIFFFEKNGRMPADGVDLLACCKSSYFSAEGQRDFMGKTPTEQARIAMLGINPATGKFYEMYDSPDWRPLGVYVERLPADEGLRLIPAPEWDEEQGKYVSGLVPHQMWRMVMFGEEPGTIIYDTTVGRRFDMMNDVDCGGCG